VAGPAATDQPWTRNHVLGYGHDELYQPAKHPPGNGVAWLERRERQAI